MGHKNKKSHNKTTSANSQVTNAVSENITTHNSHELEIDYTNFTSEDWSNFFRNEELEKNQRNELNNNTEGTNSTLNGWFKDSIQVQYKDTTELFAYKGHKVYGIISPEYLEDWQSILDKGCASSAHGKEGAKFIDNTLIELKILGKNGGSRLYTKELHQNDNGDFLAIFNKEGNHRTISKEVKNHNSITILPECASTTNDIDDSQDDLYSFDLFNVDNSFDDHLEVAGDVSECIIEDFS